MLDILLEISSGYLSSSYTSILGAPLSTSHGNTHEVWLGRPPVTFTGSYTRWCDTIRTGVAKPALCMIRIS